jgi:hypothetical protein
MRAIEGWMWFFFAVLPWLFDRPIGLSAVSTPSAVDAIGYLQRSEK